MQLPENIVQIGETDEFYKIYIEDYVHTYIKQYESEPANKRIRIYLFGKILSGEQTGYFYIYGAANSENGILSTQHEFFPEYDIIGVLSVYHGEKEISLQNGTAFLLKGYFVFYEQNEAMQNFLIHNYHQKEAIAGKEETTSRVNRQIPLADNREYQSFSKYQKKPAHTKPQKYCNQTVEKRAGQAGGFFYLAAGGLAIVICIVAITSINRYDELQGFNDQVLQALNQDSQGDIYIEEIREEPSAEMTYEEKTEYPEQPSTETMAAIEPETETNSIQSADETKEIPAETEIEAANIPKEVIYVVKQGDTLERICRNYYGSDQKIKQVCEENLIEDPDDIIPGQKIVLP